MVAHLRAAPEKLVERAGSLAAPVLSVVPAGRPVCPDPEMENLASQACSDRASALLGYPVCRAPDSVS